VRGAGRDERRANISTLLVGVVVETAVLKLVAEEERSVSVVPVPPGAVMSVPDAVPAVLGCTHLHHEIGRRRFPALIRSVGRATLMMGADHRKLVEDVAMSLAVAA
jgi:hypothetical protein